MVDYKSDADAIAFSIDQGARQYQQDACRTQILHHKHFYHEPVWVLSDGMGGHAAGDIASKITVETIFHDLEKGYRDLEASVQKANYAIKMKVDADRALHGMGATVVTGYIQNNRLYYSSVGDSPMWVIRNGSILRINDDHSMKPIIQKWAKEGRITQQQADTHPDRNSLISSLIGEDIPSIDTNSCPLKKDDILIIASDGLETLHDNEILRIVMSLRGDAASVISQKLIRAVINKRNPKQDNVTVAVIHVNNFWEEDRSRPTHAIEAHDYWDNGVTKSPKFHLLASKINLKYVFIILLAILFILMAFIAEKWVRRFFTPVEYSLEETLVDVESAVQTNNKADKNINDTHINEDKFTINSAPFKDRLKEKNIEINEDFQSQIDTAPLEDNNIEVEPEVPQKRFLSFLFGGL